MSQKKFHTKISRLHLVLHLILCCILSFPISECLEVTLIPSGETIAVLGGNETFTCVPMRRSSDNQFLWKINGVILDNRDLPTNIFSNQIFEIATLTISNLTIQNNGTTIQCIVANNSRIYESQEVILLLTAGRLSVVGNLTLTLQNMMLFLMWTAPSVIGVLNDYDPSSTTYCVEVVSSVTFLPIQLVCGLNMTRFTYHLPSNSWCQLFAFTITSQNEATIGELSVSRLFVGAQTGPELAEILPSSQHTSLIMTAPVCRAELTFLDVGTGESITLENTDLTIAESNITFTTQQLRRNRHYNVTVKASNIAGSVSCESELSTHGIQDFVVKTKEKGIWISIEFSEVSVESGALLFFIDDMNFTALALNRNMSLNYSLPYLFPGSYRVLIYDIEEDGTVLEGVGYPAFTSLLNTSFDGHTSNLRFIQPILAFCTVYIITISVTFHIVAECACNSSIWCSSMTGFQLLALSINTDGQELYVNTSSHGQSEVVVSVTEKGMYLVTVFAIQKGVGILNSMVYYNELLEVGGIQEILPNISVLGKTPEANFQPTGTGASKVYIVVVGVVGTLVVAAAIIAVVSNLMFCQPKYQNKDEPRISSIKQESCHEVTTAESRSISSSESHTTPETYVTNFNCMIEENCNLNARGMAATVEADDNAYIVLDRNGKVQKMNSSSRHTRNLLRPDVTTSDVNRDGCPVLYSTFLCSEPLLLQINQELSPDDDSIRELKCTSTANTTCHLSGYGNFASETVEESQCNIWRSGNSPLEKTIACGHRKEKNVIVAHKQSYVSDRPDSLSQ